MIATISIPGGAMKTTTMSWLLARDVQFLDCAADVERICEWARDVELHALHALHIALDLDLGTERLLDLRAEVECAYYAHNANLMALLPKIKTFDVAVAARRVRAAISFEDLRAKVIALEGQLAHSAAPSIAVAPRCHARRIVTRLSRVYEETI